MITDNHTVASYFARAHLDNAVRLGGQESSILNRAGLTRGLLQQMRSRVSAKQLATIVRATWAASDDELMGLTTQKIKLGVFPLLANQLLHYKTLGEALQHTVTFYNLITDQMFYSLEQLGDQVHFSIIPKQALTLEKAPRGLPPKSLLIEYLLLVWHRFPSWLVGQVINLNKVTMQYPVPSHHQEYRLMFNCPCEYQSQSNTLVFDAEFLSLPIIQNSTELEKYLTEIPLQWFRKQIFHDTCSAQVMRILEESAPPMDTSLENIAQIMHMTSRTLRRKLTAEGSGFQQLKDNARRDRAINFFEDHSLSISEIGRRLGYTEPATFTRAFKQWTGVSPSAYRNYSIGNVNQAPSTPKKFP